MPDSMPNMVCPNCGSHPGTGQFCPSCGQKNKPTRLNLGTIFGELFSVLFNLDNQFFRTLGAAFIPGKLATEFALGKRKSYLHPVRFFFYSWLLFALILNWTIEPDKKTPTKKEHRFSAIFKLKNDSTSVPVNQDVLDSPGQELKKDDFQMHFGFGRDLHFVADSSKVIPANDSLITVWYDDLENLSKDSLFHKYEITNWLDKFKLERAQRIDESFMDIFQYMLDHFIWLFFAVIPFSALFLWLLFGRTKRYYAEHILYLLYLFSVIFIFLTIVAFLDALPINVSWIVVLLLMLALTFYSYWSMKKYYGQGHLKTFFKWNAYLLVNFFLFLIFTVFYAIVSSALF